MVSLAWLFGDSERLLLVPEVLGGGFDITGRVLFVHGYFWLREKRPCSRQRNLAATGTPVSFRVNAVAYSSVAHRGKPSLRMPAGRGRRLLFIAPLSSGVGEIFFIFNEVNGWERRSYPQSSRSFTNV